MGDRCVFIVSRRTELAEQSGPGENLTADLGIDTRRSDRRGVGVLEIRSEITASAGQCVQDRWVGESVEGLVDLREDGTARDQASSDRLDPDAEDGCCRIGVHTAACSEQMLRSTGEQGDSGQLHRGERGTEVSRRSRRLWIEPALGGHHPSDCPFQRAHPGEPDGASRRSRRGVAQDPIGRGQSVEQPGFWCGRCRRHPRRPVGGCVCRSPGRLGRAIPAMPDKPWVVVRWWWTVQRWLGAQWPRPWSEARWTRS